MAIRLVQPEKAVPSIVQFLGRRICVKPVQSLKAFAPMAVQVSGTYTTRMTGLPSNALSSMVLIAAGSVNVAGPKTGAHTAFTVRFCAGMVDGRAGFQRWKIKLALAEFAVRSAFYFGIRITARVPLPSGLRIVSVPRHIRSRRCSTFRSPT